MESSSTSRSALSRIHSLCRNFLYSDEDPLLSSTHATKSLARRQMLVISPTEPNVMEMLTRFVSSACNEGNERKWSFTGILFINKFAISMICWQGFLEGGMQCVTPPLLSTVYRIDSNIVQDSISSVPTMGFLKSNKFLEFKALSTCESLTCSLAQWMITKDSSKL